MNLSFINELCLAEIKNNIGNNLSRYNECNEWLTSYFNEREWFHESNLFPSKPIELILPNESGNYDIENTIRLYSSLSHLSPLQAADERIWAYLTHVTFWDYMIRRWPAEGKSIESIKERYFFMTNRDRGLLRNGISRLWWFGYTTFDSERTDPFELTKILLSKQDIALNILERSYSRSIKITRSILSVYAEMSEDERKGATSRDAYRGLAKYFNYLGGVSMLDSYEVTELKDIVRRFYSISV